MTGEWPDQQIDHKNRVHDDNRWFNLREASDSGNGANKAKYRNNSTGYKGVTPYKNGRFRAQIKKNGVVHHLGIRDTAYAAHLLYVQAAKELHGEFASP